MKEIIGKVHQHNKSNLPHKPFVDKKYITLEATIAKKFNKFFTGIDPSLARINPTPSKLFFEKSQHHLTLKMSYHKRIKGRPFLPKDEQEYRC